jgi:hypothetical protein
VTHRFVEVIEQSIEQRHITYENQAFGTQHTYVPKLQEQHKTQCARPTKNILIHRRDRKTVYTDTLSTHTLYAKT